MTQRSEEQEAELTRLIAEQAADEASMVVRPEQYWQGGTKYDVLSLDYGNVAEEQHSGLTQPQHDLLDDWLTDQQSSEVRYYLEEHFKADWLETYFLVFGEMLSIRKAAEKQGISKTAVHYRIRQMSEAVKRFYVE